MKKMFSLSDLEEKKPPETEGRTEELRKPNFRTAKGNGKPTEELLTEKLGQLEEYRTVTYCTGGKWSMHDLLRYCLKFTGKADLYFTTWALSEDSVRIMHELKEEEKIGSLSAVLDYRINDQKPKPYQFLKGYADRLALAKCHAKVFVLEGELLSACVLSSANFSKNSRIEAGVLSCDPVFCDFHKNWITDVLDGKPIH